MQRLKIPKVGLPSTRAIEPWERGLGANPKAALLSSTTVRLFLADLLPDTQYEVESSSEESFPGDNSAFEIFITEPAPRVSKVNVEGITECFRHSCSGH